MFLAKIEDLGDKVDVLLNPLMKYGREKVLYDSSGQVLSLFSGLYLIWRLAGIEYDEKQWSDHSSKWSYPFAWASFAHLRYAES